MAYGHSGKVKATNVISQKEGPTFDSNDPAKFPNKGKAHGKTMSNGVETWVPGPTFTCNSTHIPTMNADKPAKEKELASKKWFDPHTDAESADALTASKGGSGSPTERLYPLKKSYEK